MKSNIKSVDKYIDTFPSDARERLKDFRKIIIENEHRIMKNPTVTPGNGLILYFRTQNLNDIRQNVKKMGGTVEEKIYINPNSRKKEFSIKDPDGYYLTITEFHRYEG